MGAANRLTISRFVLTPIAAITLTAEWSGWQPVSLAVVGLAAITDLFDGIIARRRNQVTALGTLLDPIADKFFISTVFLCLVSRGLCPVWIAIVIIGREFAVTALRMVALENGARVPVSLLGKIKMHAQVYAVLIVVFGAWYPVAAPLGLVGLWIASAFTIWSGFDYFVRFRKVAVPG